MNINEIRYFPSFIIGRKLTFHRCSIQELRSGQLSVGATGIAMQILKEGLFVFGTKNSTSPLTSHLSSFSMRVEGVHKLDHESYAELAKKLVIFLYLF